MKIKEKRVTNILHVYGQTHEHQDVIIVGNSGGLMALKKAIDVALAGNVGEKLVFVNDGEGFYVKAKCLNSDYGDLCDPRWVNIAVPYTGEGSEEHRPNAIFPHNDKEFCEQE